MNLDKNKFRREISPATRDELEQLISDGYWIHKEWCNGFELRKGKKFRGWVLFLQMLCPVLLFPGFMRSVVDNLCGYRYRLIVTIDAGEPKSVMV